ncbi:hypothetical protein Gotri_024113 [Gossypium trilobum]|uniref:Uncharacterized protein n=1 Tax=Gossypium trilobum TaxID=34281 RepID=A0A7J9DM15_9ROSI|nr:hypothetical protein [Gossypium trilobum]
MQVSESHGRVTWLCDLTQRVTRVRTEDGTRPCVSNLKVTQPERRACVLAVNGNTHGILESSGETEKLKELEESGTTIFIDALGRLVRDVRDKGSGGNFVGSKGGWKINKTLKGSSNQFKATGRSRVSFLRTMLKVADLITFELEGHVVQEKATKGK